ncbi:MAG: two-component sensor histidine kinase [Methylococcaceae bacterium]|nr:two-component sensor histidine kinase [Methylococcaceae bacterium]
MVVNKPKIIYPCPFSKGYGMPATQAWQLLSIYYVYRFILACSFTLLFYLRVGPSLFLFSAHNGHLYAYSSLTYLITTLIFGFLVFWRIFGYSILVQLLIFTDIFMLTLIMHASGGTSSGVGILPAISVAAGGLLVGGRCALVFAAIASLSILGAEIFTSELHFSDKTNYSYAGMLGATYFAIALLSVVLARRSEQMLKLADEQQHTIIQLEELNQYIIQNLQSGIIITDEKQTIQMANQAASRLTNLTEMPDNLVDISVELSNAFKKWLAASDHDIAMLKLSHETEIKCRFMALPTYQHVYYMVLLEDISLYNQRLQQSKLASLGRLTASIAHEIRNPLGAISHAGQLLSESPQLTSQDQRLTKIIQSNSTRVNRIIEDILNLSRRTDSAREKIDVVVWIKDYVENFIIENGISESPFYTMLGEHPVWAIIDPAHLKQIMDNLCQNALRYGEPEKGQIAIRINKTSFGPCIEILDNGPGISAEHRKQLFEPFFTTSPSGTGLGLYISRELAELNQAKLIYYLTDENRSCFSLCLQDANLTTIEI